MGKNRNTFILLGLILLLPLGFMWQGLDLTDTGYTVANMQHFFRCYPNELSDAGIGSCWLTYVIGGIWYKITGGCGLIGFRVLYLLITFSILGLAWLSLRRADCHCLPLIFFAAMAMVIANSAYIPSYNEVTALCFMVAALAMYHGLVNSRALWIFLAGLAAGISVFARLPNIAIAGILAAIIYFRVEQILTGQCVWKVAVRVILWECLAFVGGYLAGLAVIVLVMAVLGHLTAYGNMLRELSAMFGDPEQHHGGSRLLRGLLHDYFYSGLAALAFLFAGSGLGWLANKSSRAVKLILTGTVAIGLTAFLLVFDEFGTYFWPGVLYAVLIAVAAGLLGADRKYRLLCVLAGLLLFVTPLGSNNGVYNIVYAMHLAVPVVLIALMARPELSEGNRPAGLSNFWSRLSGGVLTIRRRIDTRPVGYVLLLAMICSSLVHRWQFTYRDSPQRMDLRARIDHPKLHGVFTTSSRANCVSELLRELRPLVHKDGYLMDHMQLPMVYFLTETKPYLYSTWANLYEPPVLTRMIERALTARSGLPVCVLTKGDTCSPEWPDRGEPLRQPDRFAQNLRLITSFMEAHNYQKRWENSAFEIWVPRSRRNET